MGLRMATISIFVLVVLSEFLLLHSVEAEDRNHQVRHCVASFPCGKLGEIAFPYTRRDHPECGLFVVDGCEEDNQEVQLEHGGRWYQLEKISPADTFTIYDEELAKQLNSNDCQSWKNWSLPNLPFVTFETSTLTLCKCNRALNNSFLKEFSHIVCNNSTIYYSEPKGTSEQLDSKNDGLSGLCNCPIIRLPFTYPPLDRSPPMKNSQHTNHSFKLFKLLSPDVLVKFRISTQCRKCFNRGGICVGSGQRLCCSKGKKKKGLELGLASSILAIVLLIILVVGLLRKFSFWDRAFIWQMKRKGDKKIEAFLKCHEFLTPKRYRYLDVKNMTNSFRDKLGKGGYGDVFKGKLLNGQLVAVKILNELKSDGEEFMNEVASISRTSHVNIVSLLGFCFEGHRRALIYEFVPNGSLEKFIFQETTDRQLKWETLYKIAVGIARGLEYLHRGCNTRILHFDIKPHNILLDDEFCPKISDFGLARLCPEKESFISMTGARGTIGYIAPEVFSRNFGKVSHKSDVYSYGMMILEMVGGRKNINVEVDRTSEIYFPQWIYNCIELDEELGLHGIMDEDDQERIRKMIIVSLWCIQTDPSNRPPMSRVVDMMEGNIDSLSMPPKPFLSSPQRSAVANSSSTILS